jgi:hypothetical protein
MTRQGRAACPVILIPDRCMPATVEASCDVRFGSLTDITKSRRYVCSIADNGHWRGMHNSHLGRAPDKEGGFSWEKTDLARRHQARGALRFISVRPRESGDPDNHPFYTCDSGFPLARE